MEMSLCQFKDALGIPGQGVHAFRVPGTTTAAADYVLTLLLAWVISATTSLPLVPTTVVLFLLGSWMHYAFCVAIG